MGFLGSEPRNLYKIGLKWVLDFWVFCSLYCVGFQNIWGLWHTLPSELVSESKGLSLCIEDQSRIKPKFVSVTLSMTHIKICFFGF